MVSILVKLVGDRSLVYVLNNTSAKRKNTARAAFHNESSHWIVVEDLYLSESIVHKVKRNTYEITWRRSGIIFTSLLSLLLDTVPDHLGLFFLQSLDLQNVPLIYFEDGIKVRMPGLHDPVHDGGR